MTQPIMNARLRPIRAPILPPGIMSIAITRVYAVIAPWIPVTVESTSSATVAIDTFMTELSSAIRNCPAASVSRTIRAVDELPCELAVGGMGGSSQRTSAVGPRPAVAIGRLAGGPFRNPVGAPVPGTDGRVVPIVCRVEETTERVRSREGPDRTRHAVARRCSPRFASCPI